MQLTYTPVKKPSEAFFEVEIEYEHGDADANTYNKKLFYSEESVIKFLSDLERLAKVLEHALYAGDDLPDDYQEEARKAGVPLEHDIIYQGNLAYMSILNIRYVDAHGAEFVVEYTE